MYYAWNWWWFTSFIIPALLIAWLVFAYGSGRYRGRTYYRDLDDGWDNGPRAERELRRRENRGRGPRNYRRSDARIYEDICDRLAIDDRIDASDIDVQVFDGKAVLQGNVMTRAEKRVAEAIAEATPGVTDVDNGLQVQALAATSRAGAPRASTPAPQP